MKKLKDIRVLVAVLTFNCSAKINELSKNLEIFYKKTDALKTSKIFSEVIVFDDCSKDDTIKLLSDKMDEKKIILSEKNLGYGGNVKKSFNYAYLNNFDYVAIFPGDMQRNFNDLCAMIEEIRHNEYDVIVGRKFKIKSLDQMPLERKVGNFILNKLSKLWNDKTKDPLSGFKIYRIETCKEIMWLCQDRFGFDLDFSFWSSIRKLNIYSYKAHVTYKNHISSMPSTIFQGMTLIIRSIILIVFLQPIIRILKKTTKAKRL